MLGPLKFILVLKLLGVFGLIVLFQNEPLPKDILSQGDFYNPVYVARKAKEWKDDSQRKAAAQVFFKLANSRLNKPNPGWSAIAKCYGEGLQVYPTSREMVRFAEFYTRAFYNPQPRERTILEEIRMYLAGAIAVDLAVPQLSPQERHQIEQDLACLNSYLAQPNRTAVSDCKYVKMIYSQK